MYASNFNIHRITFVAILVRRKRFQFAAEHYSIVFGITNFPCTIQSFDAAIAAATAIRFYTSLKHHPKNVFCDLTWFGLVWRLLFMLCRSTTHSWINISLFATIVVLSTPVVCRTLLSAPMVYIASIFHGLFDSCISNIRNDAVSVAGATHCSLN